MRWFENEKVLHELAGSPVRNDWVEQGAEVALAQVLSKLPLELRSKDRLGPLAIQPLPGVSGGDGTENYCWMMPLDGSHARSKILGPALQVKLIDTEGKIFFEGTWGETPFETIQLHERFFIWLAPPQRTR